jgi:hypothetical protein
LFCVAVLVLMLPGVNGRPGDSNNNKACSVPWINHSDVATDVLAKLRGSAVTTPVGTAGAWLVAGHVVDASALPRSALRRWCRSSHIGAAAGVAYPRPPCNVGKADGQLSRMFLSSLLHGGPEAAHENAAQRHRQLSLIR